MLRLGQSADVGFTLPVGSQVEEITVAESATIDVENTAVAAVVGQRRSRTCPSTAATSSASRSSRPASPPTTRPQQGASATSGLSFTGQRARSNNIMVDGLDNNDPIVGSVRAVFSQEAVREFQVLTNSFSAEFGKASGGVVNIVTKSGHQRVPRQRVHVHARRRAEREGPLREAGRLRQRRSTARSRPTARSSSARRSAGPIKKDQTFFFLSFERLDIEANNFVTISDADAADPEPRGLPGHDGCQPLHLRGHAAPGQDQPPVEPEPQPGPARELLGPQQREHRALRRAHRAQPRRRAAAHRLRRVARGDGHPLAALGARGAPAVGARGAAHQLARPQLRRALRRLRPGRADARGGGRRQRRPPALHAPTRAPTTASSSRTPSPTSAGSHVVKAGLDFGWLDSRDTALPLHFGGRYLFRALPAIPGLIPQALSPIQAVAAGIPAAYIQGYGEPGGPVSQQDLSLFVQDEWRVGSRLVDQARRPLPAAVVARLPVHGVGRGRHELQLPLPGRRQQHRPAARARLRPEGQRPHVASTRRTASSTTTRSSPRRASRTRSAAARTACARWSPASPRRWCSAPGARPATACPRRRRCSCWAARIRAS